MIRSRLLSATALLLSLTLLACSGAKTNNALSSSPSVSIPSLMPVDKNLVGTTWTLTSLADAQGASLVIPGKVFTLSFSNHGYGGSDANSGNYGGQCSTDGDSIRFGTTTYAGYTAADEPRGFLKQYQLYFYLLGGASRFQIAGDQLILDCVGGKLLFSKSQIGR